MKTIILAQTVVCAMMHGASYFRLPLRGSNVATVVYTDGTLETGEIPAELAAQVRAYHAYQTRTDAPESPEPNGFALVSAIQSHRSRKPDLSDSGPYATGDDSETARELGITVAGLRSDRASEDKAS